MKTTNYWEQELKENSHELDIKPMYSNNGTLANIITLKPGERIKPHMNPVDTFFFILEGNPTIHVSDEDKTCHKYTLVESPANILYYMCNNSSETARIFVVKEPPLKLVKEIGEYELNS